MFQDPRRYKQQLLQTNKAKKLEVGTSKQSEDKENQLTTAPKTSVNKNSGHGAVGSKYPRKKVKAETTTTALSRRCTYEILAPIISTDRLTRYPVNRPLSSITDLEREKLTFEIIASPGIHNESLDRAAANLAEHSQHLKNTEGSNTFTISTASSINVSETDASIRRTTYEVLEPLVSKKPSSVQLMGNALTKQTMARLSSGSVDEKFDDSLEDKIIINTECKNSILDFSNIDLDTSIIQDQVTPLSAGHKNILDSQWIGGLTEEKSEFPYVEFKSVNNALNPSFIQQVTYVSKAKWLSQVPVNKNDCSDVEKSVVSSSPNVLKSNINFSNVCFDMTITKSDSDKYFSEIKELKREDINPDDIIISSRSDKQTKSFQIWDQDTIDVTMTKSENEKCFSKSKELIKENIDPDNISISSRSDKQRQLFQIRDQDNSDVKITDEEWDPIKNSLTGKYVAADVTFLKLTVPYQCPSFHRLNQHNFKVTQSEANKLENRNSGEQFIDSCAFPSSEKIENSVATKTKQLENTVDLNYGFTKQTPSNSFVDHSFSNIKSSTPVHSSSTSLQTGVVDKAPHQLFVWDVSPPAKIETTAEGIGSKRELLVTKVPNTIAAIRTLASTLSRDVCILPTKPKHITTVANVVKDNPSVTVLKPISVDRLLTVTPRSLKRSRTQMNKPVKVSSPKIRKVAQYVKRLSTPTLRKPIASSMTGKCDTYLVLILMKYQTSLEDSTQCLALSYKGIYPGSSSLKCLKC